MSYSKTINRLKKIQMILIIVMLAAFIGYVFMITRPELTAYVVKDECGPIGGTISHSIDDDDSCANACRARCQSIDKEFYDSMFLLKETECHNCTCFCKDLNKKD